MPDTHLYRPRAERKAESDANRARINWGLLQQLAVKPHPNQNHVPHDGLPLGVGEVLQEALAAQHLLDIIGIPLGLYDDQHIDARTFLAVLEVQKLGERLARIASWHSRETGPGGMVDDYCTECRNTWPCDTRRMAEGTYTDPEEPADA